MNRNIRRVNSEEYEYGDQSDIDSFVALTTGFCVMSSIKPITEDRAVIHVDNVAESIVLHDVKVEMQSPYDSNPIHLLHRTTPSAFGMLRPMKQLPNRALAPDPLHRIILPC